MVARQRSSEPASLADRSRVFDTGFPHVYGTIVKAGEQVSEVKWDQPTPWGATSNTINKHLRLVEGDNFDIPKFLLAKNRKPLTPEERKQLIPIKAQAVIEEKRDFSLPRNVEPAGLAILEASRATKAEKTAERIADLKANHPPKGAAPKGSGVIATVIETISQLQGASIDEIVTILKSKFPERIESKLLSTTKVHAKKHATEIESDKKRGKVFYRKG